ncbi:MAG: pyridoxamine 5'-phosphate oxidase family protein [Huintestinicola sp.]
MTEEMLQKAKEIMNGRFGRDSLIALATVSGDIPYVRTVDGFYENGSFYVITYKLSDKMKQIEVNPNIALSGEWFTAHGTGEDMGWFGKNENKAIADKLRKAFAAWIDNGHNNFDDENTCILRIRLTKGVLFADGVRYDIDFTSDHWQE